MSRIVGRAAGCAVVAVGIAAVSLGVLAGPAAAQPTSSAGTGVVTLVHGIPNFTAAVFVDHTPVLPDFKAYSVSKPLQLSAGRHTIDIYPATNVHGVGQPTLESTMTLGAGQNVSWVAHTDLSNHPTFTSWVNDMTGIANGQTRFVMRHMAVTGAVDILANGQKAVGDVTYGHQASVDVASGTVQATVVRSGTDDRLAGPLPVTFVPDSEYIAYGVGSQRAGTLSVVVQQLQLPARAASGNALGATRPEVPAGVPAGTGGFAAAPDGVPAWVWVASVGGIVIALISGGVGMQAARARR